MLSSFIISISQGCTWEFPPIQAWLVFLKFQPKTVTVPCSSEMGTSFKKKWKREDWKHPWKFWATIELSGPLRHHFFSKLYCTCYGHMLSSGLDWMFLVDRILIRWIFWHQEHCLTYNSYRTQETLSERTGMDVKNSITWKGHQWWS